MKFEYDSLKQQSASSVEVLDKEPLMPFSVFVNNSSESFELSTEGFIQNIIDWWQRRKKEAAARKKAANKARWQSSLEGYFDSYIRWLDSIPASKIKDMEIHGLSYDEWTNIINAANKYLKVISGVDPFKFKTITAMITDMGRGNTPKIIVCDESGTSFCKYGKPKLRMFKGSKFDKEAEMKRMLKVIMDMDNAAWDFMDKADIAIETFNKNCQNMTPSEYNTKKKCLLAWLNSGYFIADKVISIEKGIIASCNSF